MSSIGEKGESFARDGGVGVYPTMTLSRYRYPESLVHQQSSEPAALMMVLIGALIPENGAGFAFDKSPGVANVNGACPPMLIGFSGDCILSSPWREFR